MAHGCVGGGVGDVEEGLLRGLGLEEEEEGVAELQGWVGGGFDGLGGAGACFLVPGI